MPPAIASMWRLFKLGYSHEPRLLAFAVVVTILSAVPDALLALWLKLLADGVTSHQSGQVPGPRSGWRCRWRSPG